VKNAKKDPLAMFSSGPTSKKFSDLKKVKAQEKNAVVIKKVTKPNKPQGRQNKDIDDFMFDEEADAAGD
jgi:hypothetical protein